mmetsp:Transcript_120702/g.341324  ORF Transcript_120702/g.341324 Transcript_120702/m.341324 type:complete len:206 (-) Transcript_120702:485-1102(-)
MPVHLPPELVAVPAAPHDDIGAVADLALAHAGAVSRVQFRTQQVSINDPLELVAGGQAAAVVCHREAFSLGRLAHPEDDIRTVASAAFPHCHAIVVSGLVLDVLPNHLPLELVAVPARPKNDVGSILGAALSDAQAVLWVCLVLNLIAIDDELELLISGAAPPENDVGSVARPAVPHAQAPARVGRELDERSVHLPPEGVARTRP